jgi:hypothetical protein
MVNDSCSIIALKRREKKEGKDGRGELCGSVQVWERVDKDYRSMVQ